MSDLIYQWNAYRIRKNNLLSVMEHYKPYSYRSKYLD
ncbi:hypothetical protein EMIT091MI3_60002 [Kosakonia quasisacchari]